MSSLNEIKGSASMSSYMKNGNVDRPQKMRVTFHPSRRQLWMEEVLKKGQTLRVRIKRTVAGHDVYDTVTADTLLKLAVEPVEVKPADSLESNAQKQSVVKIEPGATTFPEGSGGGVAPESEIKSVDGKRMEIKSPPRKGKGELHDAQLEFMTRKMNEMQKSFEESIAVMQKKLTAYEHQDDYTLKERETWVFDEEMKEIENRLFRYFKNKNTGEQEHPEVHQLRLAFWDILVASLTDDYVHLTQKIYVGDVRQLWCAVAAVAQQNTGVTAYQIETTIRTHVKKASVGYPVWAHQLDQMYNQLALMRRPKSDSQKVMDLLQLFGKDDQGKPRSDPRYAVLIKKITKKPDMSYEEAQAKMLARATDIGDLQSTQEKSTKTPKNSSVNNTTKTPEGGQKERTSSTPPGGRGKGGRGRGRGGKGRGGRGGDEPERKQGQCLFFLAGSCLKGAECSRRHTSLEDIKKQYGKERGGKGGKGWKKNASSEREQGAEDEKTAAPCFQWRDERACERGDDCRFSHVNNVMRTEGDMLSQSEGASVINMVYTSKTGEQQESREPARRKLDDTMNFNTQPIATNSRNGSVLKHKKANYGKSSTEKSEKSSTEERFVISETLNPVTKADENKTVRFAEPLVSKPEFTTTANSKGELRLSVRQREDALPDGIEHTYHEKKPSRMKASMRPHEWFLQYSPNDLVVLHGFGKGKSGKDLPLEGVRAQVMRVLKGEGMETRYRVQLLQNVKDKIAVDACFKIGIAHENMKLFEGEVLKPTLKTVTTTNNTKTHRVGRENQYHLKVSVDSGTEDSLNPHFELFEPGSLYTLPKPVNLGAYNGVVSERVTHAGTIILLGDEGVEREVKDVLYSPESRRLLLNTRSLSKHTWELGEGETVLRDRGEIIMREENPEGATMPLLPDWRMKRSSEVIKPFGGDVSWSYSVESSAVNTAVKTAAMTAEQLLELHDALGHPSMEKLAALVGWYRGVVIPAHVVQHAWCASCMLAQSKNLPTVQVSQWWKAESVLEHVSADLIILQRTLNGFTAFLLIVDWWSRMKFGVNLRTKAEAGKLLVTWIRWAQREHNKTIRNLHIDGGEMNSVLVEEMVNNRDCSGAMHVNEKHAHNHNAMAERHIQEVERLAMASSQRGGGDPQLYEYAFPYACETANLMPLLAELRKSKTTRKGVPRERPLSPLEKWKGHRLTLDALLHGHLPLFGEVICHVPPEMRRSHEIPAFRAMFLGLAHPRVGPGKQKNASLVKRYSDGKVTTARVARATGVYPLKMHLTTLNRGNVYKWMHNWRKQLFQPTFDLPSELEEDEKTNENQNDELVSKSVSHDDEMLEAEPLINNQNVEDIKKGQDSDEEQPDEHITKAQKAQEEQNLDDENTELAWGNRHESVKVSTPRTRAQVRTELDRLGAPALERQKDVEQSPPDEGGVDSVSSRRAASKDAQVEKLREQFAEKYPQGTRVMTTHGPAIVMTAPDSEKELEVVYGSSHSEREQRYTIPAKDGDALWLPEEYPDEVFDSSGNQIDLKSMSEANMTLRTEGDESLFLELVCDAEMHTYHHGYLDPTIETQKAESLVRDINMTSLLVPTELPGYDMASLKGKVLATVVDDHIPRFWHLQKKTKLYPLISQGEDKEIQGLLLRGCFGTPRELEYGEKPIGLMWVTKAKAGENGWFKEMKLRLTLLGNQERHMLERVRAYAPVSMLVTVRMILAMHINDIGVIRVRKIDITQAYVSTRMKRKVVVKHPPGMVVYPNRRNQLVYRRLKPGESAPTSVLPLLLALYGGMECGRLFWDDFVAYHLALGFKTAPHEKCLLCLTRGGEWIKFCFHVDDSVHVSYGDKLWHWYLEQLGKRYKYTEGEVTDHLGTRYRIDRKKKTIQMDQILSIEKMLRHLNMEGCKPAKTPAFGGQLPCEADCPTCPKELARVMNSFPMGACIGSLIWLEQTKPGLVFVIRILSKAIKKYGELHIKWAKHAVRWVAYTKHQPLTYRAGYELGLQIFTDASHAGCQDTRRSLAGVIVKYGGNTLWCKAMWLQIVAHSSQESELMSEFRGMTIGQYVTRLQDELGGPPQRPVPIFVDNQAALDFVHNPIQTGRNLHMHARFYYAQDCVHDGEFKPLKIASEDQISDLLVSWKGRPNFDKLYPLVIDCAQVEMRGEGKDRKAVWDMSLIA